MIIIGLTIKLFYFGCGGANVGNISHHDVFPILFLLIVQWDKIAKGRDKLNC